ncbi:MAG: Butyryl-CoA dehydrogenase [Chloroflexi bacterium]|jgi:alkylation response protein AidB-like acyl-CoA dehydrogenase|nr:Butyryl-CoA dehydrogenase [Chloroflexota bacterium]
MPRSLFEEQHEDFRDSFRRFLEREVVPHYDRWERDGIVPRDLFRRAGAHGFLAMGVPEEHGGAGADDFRFNVVVNEETQGIGAGLQTRAVRNGDHYVVSGSKTFITNGINADLVITAVRTDANQRHGGISLLVIERDAPGFERGRNLEKLGLHAQDTAELFFHEVEVPVDNLLGAEGQGFALMVSNLPQERLSIAVTAVAAARAALEWTLAYVRERCAFGRPIGTFQQSRQALAEMRTEVEIAGVFLDRCIEAQCTRALTAEQAAMAKWWCTELQGRVVDRCVQLHGGYGYMLEYPIARAYADARVTRIFGGTTEIMKEIIGRADGLG